MKNFVILSMTSDSNDDPSIYWYNASYRVHVPNLSMAISLSCCILSISCSFFTLLICIRTSIIGLSLFCRRLLYHVNIANLIHSLFILCGLSIHLNKRYGENTGDDLNSCQSDRWCQLQSAFLSYASTASIMWTLVSCLYVTMKVNIRLYKQGNAFEQMNEYMQAICWGIPIIISCLTLSTGVFGYDFSWTTGGWCGISACEYWRPLTKIWLLLWTGKLWEFLCFICVGAMIIHLIVGRCVPNHWFIDKLVDSGSNADQPQKTGIKLKEILFIFAIPICQFLVRITGIVRFFIAFSAILYQSNEAIQLVKSSSEYLVYFQGILEPSQGTFNFLMLIILSKDFRHGVLQLFKRKTQNEITNL